MEKYLDEYISLFIWLTLACAFVRMVLLPNKENDTVAKALLQYFGHFLAGMISATLLRDVSISTDVLTNMNWKKVIVAVVAMAGKETVVMVSKIPKEFLTWLAGYASKIEPDKKDNQDGGNNVQ